MKPILLQPAFILHRHLYRETSLLVDILTRDHGRLTGIVKGVRKANSFSQGLLQPFTPLLISWSGKSELKTFYHFELNGAVKRLQGDCLFAGFYLNELLLRLLQKWDPHPKLFKVYADTVTHLQASPLKQAVLRAFEKKLLEEIGYGVLMEINISLHNTFAADKYYRFTLDKGFILSDGGENADQSLSNFIFLGKSLLAIAKEDWQDEKTLQDAKRLMRIVLTPLLGQRPLKSRELFIRPTEENKNKYEE